MSRTLIIHATLDRVTSTFARLEAPISAVETPVGGLTRMVLRNADAAPNVARAYANSVVTGPAARMPVALSSQGVPITQR